MRWHDGPMVAFDTETTGIDPTEARIVTACVAHVAAGSAPRVRSWIANPGIPIPPEATAVHGITDERARAEGADPADVADEVARELIDAWRSGHPVVAMNFAYDGTVLDHELRRHGLPSLDDRLDDIPMLVVDPLVIDRALDRFRPGKKRLSELCEVYRVPLDDAHDACADALAAARVAWRMAERFPDDLQRDLVSLQSLQATWHRAWAESFEEWMRGNVDPATAIDRVWPMRPAATAVDHRP
jgi:DNA polymerase III subunit epsilon